jgi:hypothetical protein
VSLLFGFTDFGVEWLKLHGDNSLHCSVVYDAWKVTREPEQKNFLPCGSALLFRDWRTDIVLKYLPAVVTDCLPD